MDGEVTSGKKIQAALGRAWEKFSALDKDMDLSLVENISRWLWGPWAALVLIGIFGLIYQAWWLFLLAIVAIVLWDVIAMLSFKRPESKLIMPPKLTMEAMVNQPFHWISKSRRVVFLIAPFLVLALVHEFQATMLSWTIALILLGLLRFLLRYDRWISKRYFEDRDYVALALASLVGLVCFFGAYPSAKPAVADNAQSPRAQEQKERDQAKLEEVASARDSLEKFLPVWQKAVEEVESIRTRQEQDQARIAELEKEKETLKLKTAKLEEDSKALKLIEGIQIRLAKLENDKALMAMEESQKDVLSRIAALEKMALELPAFSQELQQLATRTATLEEDNSTQRLMDAHVRVSAVERDLQSAKPMLDSLPEIQRRILNLEGKIMGVSGGPSEERMARMEEAAKKLPLVDSSLQNLQKEVSDAKQAIGFLKELQQMQKSMIEMDRESKNEIKKEIEVMKQRLEALEKKARDGSN